MDYPAFSPVEQSIPTSTGLFLDVVELVQTMPLTHPGPLMSAPPLVVLPQW
ncbi:hypothetical protein L6R53_09730 [Myxococcota bacterium]|nr:hypothetical protein [Myxococcota bacterium]